MISGEGLMSRPVSNVENALNDWGICVDLFDLSEM